MHSVNPFDMLSELINESICLNEKRGSITEPVICPYLAFDHDNQPSFELRYVTSEEYLQIHNRVSVGMIIEAAPSPRSTL